MLPLLVQLKAADTGLDGANTIVNDASTHTRSVIVRVLSFLEQTGSDGKNMSFSSETETKTSLSCHHP